MVDFRQHGPQGRYQPLGLGMGERRPGRVMGHELDGDRLGHGRETPFDGLGATGEPYSGILQLAGVSFETSASIISLSTLPLSSKLVAATGK